MSTRNVKIMFLGSQVRRMRRPPRPVTGIALLFFIVDFVYLLGNNIDTIKKNTEILIDGSKGVGLEINVDKTKYMLLSRHQNVDQNRDIKIANR
jgi:hypothetical protein